MKALAWKIVLIACGLEILFWLMLLELGGGYLSPLNNQTGGELLNILIRIWEFMHWPVQEFLLPALIQYMPSHGGGWVSRFAEGIYVLACGVQLGLVCVMATAFARKTSALIGEKEV